MAERDSASRSSYASNEANDDFNASIRANMLRVTDPRSGQSPAPRLECQKGASGNALGNVAAAKVLLRWSATEREAWLDAVINDPLRRAGFGRRIIWGNKPGVGLSCGSLGEGRRVEVLRAANRQLRTFKPA